jgi:hypothetical protein
VWASNRALRALASLHGGQEFGAEVVAQLPRHIDGEPPGRPRCYRRSPAENESRQTPGSTSGRGQILQVAALAARTRSDAKGGDDAREA